jgi:hypothetical protein
MSSICCSPCCEEGTKAATTLTTHGLTLEGARAAIVQRLAAGEQPSLSDSRPNVVDPRDQIEAIKLQIGELGRPANAQAPELIARIQRDLDELKKHVR